MRRMKAPTVYYADGGKKHTRETVTLAIARAKQLGLKHLVVFTSGGEGPLMAAERLGKDSDLKVVAVTFPAGQVFINENQELFTTELSDRVRREELRAKGIEVVQGTMPFQEVIVPGVSDAKTDTIRVTLGLLSPGMHLCVQAVLMATDAGMVEQGEEVVAMCADTAIVATGALSHWMFHPTRGLEIREVICKPRCRPKPAEESRGESGE